MFFNSAAEFASDAFRVVPTVYSIIEHDFQANLCRAVTTMLEQGQLVLNLKTPPYFSVKDDEEAALFSDDYLPLPLPFSLYGMPEHKKARLRATYARAKQIYHPGAAHLSPEQGEARTPVQLSGSNAATNIALWPSAMQVNLGYEYKSGESSNHSLKYIHTKPDFIIQGATKVLNALVAGLDEEWLEADGVSKPTEPEMDSLCAGIEFVPSPRSPQPLSGVSHLAFFQETDEITQHNRDRLRATFERAKALYRPGSCIRPSGQRSTSGPEVALHGMDAAFNVALYPRAMQVKLNEGEVTAQESLIMDPSAIVEGATMRLQSLIDGVGYKWIGVDQSSKPSTCRRIGSGRSEANTGSSSSTYSDMSRASSMASCTTASSVWHLETPREEELAFGDLVDEYYGKL